MAFRITPKNPDQINQDEENKNLQEQQKQLEKQEAEKQTSAETAYAVNTFRTKAEANNLKESVVTTIVEQNKEQLKVWLYITEAWGQKIKINVKIKNGNKEITNQWVLGNNEKPQDFVWWIIVTPNQNSKSWIEVVPIQKVAPELVSTVDTFSDWTTATTTYSPENSQQSNEDISFSPQETQEFNAIYVKEENILRNGNIPIEINPNMNIPADLAATILNIAKKRKNTTTIDWKDMNGFNYQFYLPNCDPLVANILIKRSIASVEWALREFAAGETLENEWAQNWTNSNNIEAIKKLRIDSMQYFFDTKMPWSKRQSIAQWILNMKEWQPFEWWWKTFDLVKCKWEDVNSKDPFSLQTCRSQVAFAYMSSYMCREYWGSQKVSDWMTYMYLVSKSWKYSSQTVWDIFRPWSVIPFCRPGYIETAWTTDDWEIMNNIRAGLERFWAEYQQTKQQQESALKNAWIYENFKQWGIPWVMDKVFLTLKDQYNWTDAQVANYKQWAKIGWTIGALAAWFAVLKYLWGKKDKFTAKNIFMVLWGLGLAELVAINNDKSLFAEAWKLLRGGWDMILWRKTNPDKDLDNRYKTASKEQKTNLDTVSFMKETFTDKDWKSMNVGQISKYIKDGRFDYNEFIKDHPWENATILQQLAQMTNDPERMQKEIWNWLALLGLAQVDENYRISLIDDENKTVAQAVKEYANWEAKVFDMVADMKTFFTLKNESFAEFRKKLGWANQDTINLVSNYISNSITEKYNSKFKDISDKFKASPKSQSDIETLKTETKNIVIQEIQNLKNGLDPQQAQYIDLDALSIWVDNSITKYIQNSNVKIK